MHDDQPERWLPRAEAAAKLGISTDTARRRLRKGQLAGEQRPTPQGFTWWVRVGDTAQVATAPTQPAQAPAPGLVELVDLVDRLQRENRDLAGLLGALQERVGSLQAQLALAAPADVASQKSPQRSPTDASSVEPTQTPAKPPQRAPLVDALAAARHVLTSSSVLQVAPDPRRELSVAAIASRGRLRRRCAVGCAIPDSRPPLPG